MRPSDFTFRDTCSNVRHAGTRLQRETPENNDLRLRLAVPLAVCARMYLHAASESER